MRHLEQHWFWGVLAHYAPLYAHVALASLVVNALGLAMPLFVMNVYDRIVPNSAFESLWVLTVGVALAALLDFALRTARARFVDTAGRSADVLLLGRFMDALLDTRLDASPAASVGGLLARVREFEHVRDFLGSATLLAVLDFPFVLLFMGLIFMLGGPLVCIPLLAMPCMALFAALVQWPFRRAAERQARSSIQKHSLLGEMAAGFETIRTARLERALSRRWDRVVDDAAAAVAHARGLGAMAAHSAMLVSTLLTVALVVAGVYRISEGLMSMGALIACVILLGRCLGPLCSLVNIFSNMHKTRLALAQMRQLMELPRENPPMEAAPGMAGGSPSAAACAGLSPDAWFSPGALSPEAFSDTRSEARYGECPDAPGGPFSEIRSAPGDLSPDARFSNPGGEITVQARPVDIRLEDVSFRYPGQDALTLALRGVSLHIRQGEHVAVVGPTGSGKSSLARLAAGLYHPIEGRVLLGTVDMRRAPMRAVRRRMGFLPQATHLFSGTVRDNIRMAWPDDCPFSDEALLAVAEMAGVMDFAREHPLGLDMPVGERGTGLSGGQAQAVALARALAGRPDTLILDEPTSNLDMDAEERLRLRLAPLLPGRTLLVLTHRLSMLRLASRVVVMERGCIVKDGPVEDVVRPS